MRLAFSGTATQLHAITRTETGFTVIDKATIGGRLAAVRYPIQEFFSGSRASLNNPAIDDTYTFGTQVTDISPEYVRDCVVFGNVIYTHTLGPTDFFNSSTVVVDVTNIITAHVDIANGDQWQTVRHTIDSGGVIAPLDVRAGSYLADRISDTEGVEIDVAATQFRIVDISNGDLSAPVALTAGAEIVGVLGDYGVGGIFYTIDTSAVIRKYDAAGVLLATIETGLAAIVASAMTPGQNVYLSADTIFFQRQSDSGWYGVDKDLTSVNMIGRFIAGLTGVAVSAAIPISATPDTATVVVLDANWKTYTGTMGSTIALPSPAGIRVYQMSETVGKGYPLEFVI